MWLCSESLSGVLLTLLLVGCYQPPPFDLLDEVPIAPNNRCAEAREVRVACVLDGDTFDVGSCGEGGERIRLLGIDAPEIAHPPHMAECWGPEAQSELRLLIEGRRLVLTFDHDCTGVFGRTLAYVWRPGVDGMSLVNEELLAGGFADLYDEVGDPLLRARELHSAKDLAESRGLGLWGACSPSSE